jgi:alpha-mannosidase
MMLSRSFQVEPDKRKPERKLNQLQRFVDRTAWHRQIDARQAAAEHPAPLTLEEALETTKIHSIMGLLAPAGGKR